MSMLIFVKCIFYSGKHYGTHAIYVESSYLVSDLKKIIENKFDISSDLQCLVFGAKNLNDNKKLIDYNITKESTITIIDDRINQLGGRGISNIKKNVLENFEKKI